MARLFNIPPQSSLQHISRDGLIFDSFLKAIISVNSREVYWFCIVALYLYAQFLLVSISCDYDFKFMHILNQVESGHNLVPFILAETLTGLDNLPATH